MVRTDEPSDYPASRIGVEVDRLIFEAMGVIAERLLAHHRGVKSSAEGRYCSSIHSPGDRTRSEAARVDAAPTLRVSP